MPKVLSQRRHPGGVGRRRPCRCSRGPATAASARAASPSWWPTGVDGAAADRARGAPGRGRRGAAVLSDHGSVRWRSAGGDASKSTSRSRPRRRCSSTRWCCPAAPTRSGRWQPTVARWSSSRTSTATASRSWSLGEGDAPAARVWHRRHAAQRQARSGLIVADAATIGGRRLPGGHRQASPLRPRDRSAARLRSTTGEGGVRRALPQQFDVSGPPCAGCRDAARRPRWLHPRCRCRCSARAGRAAPG